MEKDNNKNCSHLEITDGMVDVELAKELLAMSVDDRNKLHEEIHGVRCQAVKETPELIERSLLEFDVELNKIAEKNQKKSSSDENAYMIMLSRRRELLQDQDGNVQKNHYALDDPAFRMRFLRCELFVARKAAERFWKYLNFVYEQWGEIALDRPVCMEDLMNNKEHRKYLKKGHMQILPFRDRSGRRVLVHLGNALRGVDPIVLSKVIFFLYDSCTRDCIESQQAGIVVVNEFQSWDINVAKFFSMEALEMMTRSLECLPTRLVTQHMCVSNTPGSRMIVDLFFLHGYRDKRTKVNILFHRGSVQETRYRVRSFGIPTQLFPMTETGNIKLVYLNQWIKTRLILEQQEHIQRLKLGTESYLKGKDKSGQQEQSTLANHVDNTSTDGNEDPNNIPMEIEQKKSAREDRKVIVECPCLNDVVFRQGTPSWDNPGNATFRQLMLDHFAKQDNTNGGFTSESDDCVLKNANSNAHANDNLVFCDWLMDEIEVKRGGRFLGWDKERVAWVQMKTDQEKQLDKIRQKVCNAIYNCGRNFNSALHLQNQNVIGQLRSSSRNDNLNTTTHTTKANRPAKHLTMDNSYGNRGDSGDESLQYQFLNEGKRASPPNGTFCLSVCKKASKMPKRSGNHP